MAKDPAVLFYTQDFLMGSSLFTALQKGHYITLLCYQQQSLTGSLSETQVKVLMGKDYQKQWPAIKVKFAQDDNGFYNERMRKEIDRRRQYSDKQKDRVGKRWNNHGNTTVDTTVIPINGNTFLETEIEIRNKEGGAGETNPEPIGSERVAEAANKAWGDQRWREAICQGHHLQQQDLQKWMAQFNASICNDCMPDFSESKYKKIFGGWLNKQKAKGYTLADTKPQASQSPTLKIPELK